MLPFRGKFMATTPKYLDPTHGPDRKFKKTVHSVATLRAVGFVPRFSNTDQFANDGAHHFR